MDNLILTISPLSPRQREIMFYTALGLTCEQIGEKLFIEKSTVRRHRQDSYTKLGVYAGAPEAVSLLLVTDLDFYNEVRSAIYTGQDKPIEHPRGGFRPGSFCREGELFNE